MVCINELRDAKYGLMAAEPKFIESSIKPME